jgi:hypothetical protein
MTTTSIWPELLAPAAAVLTYGAASPKELVICEVLSLSTVVYPSDERTEAAVGAAVTGAGAGAGADVLVLGAGAGVPVLHALRPRPAASASVGIATISFLFMVPSPRFALILHDYRLGVPSGHVSPAGGALRVTDAVTPAANKRNSTKAAYPEAPIPTRVSRMPPALTSLCPYRLVLDATAIRTMNQNTAITVLAIAAARMCALDIVVSPLHWSGSL